MFKLKHLLIWIIIGAIAGALWFYFGERFDKNSLTPKCWERLHYLNKERFPLYIVHSKSILAGLLLIILAYTNWKYKNQIITFIGSAIIGLHIYQFINEQNLIKTKGK